MSAESNNTPDSDATADAPETGEQPMNPEQGESAGAESAVASSETTASTTGIDHAVSRAEAAESRLAELQEQLLRVAADTENLRRRHQKELENAHRFATEKLITALLPVVDSLEHAMQTLEGAGPDVTGFAEGSQLTLDMLLKVLQDGGVTVVDPKGEPFDPDFHQAMSVIESVDHAPDTVAQVVQKGYLLNGRLVRPAMVMVAKSPSAGTPG